MIEIIPAMDIIDGKCVRLSQGRFDSQTVYDVDPVETAKQFEAAGLKRLHLVDLDGARSGRPKNVSVLERVARATDMAIDFGGGIKTESDLRSVLDSGADMVSIGSLSVAQPDMLINWASEFGSDKFLLGADVRGEMIAVNGWQTDTDVSVFDHLRRLLNSGISTAFVTDIDQDGMMQGPSVDLYESITAALPNLSLIASGGVTSINDIEAVESAGCSGVIIGKAIYEGYIRLKELSTYVS